jgi:hypothetical protein
LVHSHPGGYFAFSGIDDRSDAEVIHHLFAGWCGKAPAVIGSAIMIPGGAMRARSYSREGHCNDLAVRIAGDDVLHYLPDRDPALPMAFGDGMKAELLERSACVIGVSGTGSIVAEQVARLGFGRVVLIDFDQIEAKNLNRILNATSADAAVGRPKVDMFADAIGRHRADMEVEAIAESVLSRHAVECASGADVIFSCVDSSEGRQIADLIAQAFLIPLIDMGVTIPTRRDRRGAPVVAEAIGRVDYVQPGRSSLASRGVYTPDSLRAEYLARVAPDAHSDEIAEGYIKGVHQEAPAVISLNMRAASAAVIEYLARSFPYRHESNERYARSMFRLAEMEEETFAESDFASADAPLLGVGAIEPPLGMPALERQP